MITNIDNIYKLEKKEIGYVSQETDVISSGQYCPVIIPRLLPNVNTQILTSMVNLKGTSIYKNSKECQIYSDTTIKTQVYINLKLERNNSWGNDQTKTIITGYDKLGNEITKTKILKNTQVVCNTKNNIINDATISTN